MERMPCLTATNRTFWIGCLPVLVGIFILVASFLCGPVSIAAPVALDAIPVSEDYTLRAWEVDDGLPSNTVSSVARTPDGYLWLATSSGLARFDGVRFTPFLQGDVTGLESNRVRVVFASRDGSLWVGLDRGGIARWNGRRFETIVASAPAGVSWGWTSSFAQSADGAIWFGRGSAQELLCWRNGKVSSFTSGDGVGLGQNISVCAEADGKVWFSAQKGFAAFDGKRFLSVASPLNLGWTRLAPAREGGMWVCREERLFRYQANGSFEVLAELGGMSVSTLYEDHEGDLWIGTSNLGLFRFRRGMSLPGSQGEEGGTAEKSLLGQLVRVPTSHTGVSSLTEDVEGNLWVGTQGGGLNRLRASRFFLRQKKHGLLSDSVVSLCEDSEGKLWLVGLDGVPVRGTDAGNHSFAKQEGWAFPMVLAICPDPSGGLWMGTLGGLVHWRDGVFSQETLRGPMTSLLPDREGNLWVGTMKSGLVRWRNGVTDQVSGHGLLEPRALAEDAAGRIWIGTEAGQVFHYQNEHDAPLKEEKFIPVPLPGARLDDQIRFIVPDGKETVWIGAWNSGLYRWCSGKVTRLPNGTGLPLQDLRTLIIEPTGDFCFGASGGIFSVTRGEIEAVADGRLQEMRVVSYGRNDGMPSVDVNLGFKNTATRARDGHLWFATSRGALEILPQALPKATPRLPLIIEEIQVAGASHAPTGMLTLPPKPGPVQIRYTLPQLSAPERVRFRYRLFGMEENEWISVGTQRTVTLAHLPPGEYRFEVAATDVDGEWLPETAALDMIVRAAWWETIWFRLGSGLLGAFALGWLIRLIVKRRLHARMRRLVQDRALERERIRIARDMHDQLGASLTQIAITSKLLNLDPPESVATHSDELADIARRTVESLDELVWAVDPANDILSTSFDYLCQFAVDFLAAARISCELDVALDLPDRPLLSNVRHDLFLVVKESLNNIVKHSGASAVRLKIEIVREVLRITIADNGHGFEMGSPRVSSDGLRNMRARMAELGGVFDLESHPGEGTRVILQLPLTRQAA